MARVLVTGSLGWDIPLWLDRPLKSGHRIGARSLKPQGNSAALPGRLGGGAANIASALALAGHEVLVVGRVGKDALGQYIFYALHARGLSPGGVRVDAAPTSSLQILIEPTGERTILGIGWTGTREVWSVAPDLVQRFAPEALVLRSPVPVVPSGAGLFDARLVVAHLPWPDASSIDRPERVDVAIGSRDDLGEDALAHPLQAAIAAFGAAKWGVITSGGTGVRAQSSDQTLEAPAVPADVLDATGAGDSFIAGLTDALLANASMADALAHGCRWGAAAVEMEGSAPEPGADGFYSYNDYNSRNDSPDINH